MLVHIVVDEAAINYLMQSSMNFDFESHLLRDWLNHGLSVIKYGFEFVIL